MFTIFKIVQDFLCRNCLYFKSILSLIYPCCKFNTFFQEQFIIRWSWKPVSMCFLLRVLRPTRECSTHMQTFQAGSYAAQLEKPIENQMFHCLKTIRLYDIQVFSGFCFTINVNVNWKRRTITVDRFYIMIGHMMFWSRGTRKYSFLIVWIRLCFHTTIQSDNC